MFCPLLRCCGSLVCSHACLPVRKPFPSLISSFLQASIAYGFRHVKNAGPFAFPTGTRPPPAAVAAGFALQALALGMASQTLPKLQIPVEVVGGIPGGDEPTRPVALEAAPEKRRWKVRCPFDFTDGRSQTALAEGAATQVAPDGRVSLHGLDRVTRHPGLWSFGLLGLGNALLVPSIPTRIWLSMPVMVAIIGGSHTDSRHRRGIGGQLDPAIDAITSNVPFAAMLTGLQEGGSVADSFIKLGEEVKVLNAAVAVGVTALWVARKGRGGTSSMLSSQYSKL